MIAELLLLHASLAHAATPGWSIQNDKKVTAEVLALAKLAPDEQLRELRKKGVCVKIMASGRPKPPKFFHWGEMEKPSGKLSEVTIQKALMGKTLCKGELLLSKDCDTIVVADDAPLSTLLHEYLHVKQSERHEAWCGTSKELWSRAATDSEKQLQHDKEWDVLRFLWGNRAQLNLGFEDELAIASELLEEASARSKRDPSAVELVKKEKIAKRVNELILEYKIRMGIK